MSVESEILRIQHNIANTYAAVADKGGTVPTQPTSANLAAAVASIQAGSVSLPSGGTTGQALVKASNADGDVAWGDVSNVTMAQVNAAIDAAITGAIEEAY